MRADEARRVLGVSVQATPADIKAAYRQRVKAWHPDRFGEDARLRAQAEGEVKRIIEAYHVLQHADEEPEPAEPSRPEPAGASMFTVRAAPHHTKTAAWAQHRRREELARERRLRRIELIRRGAVLFGGLAVVVVLWRSAAWAHSLVWQEPPAVVGAALIRAQNEKRSQRLNVDFVDRQVSLADRTACYGVQKESRACLEARAFERLSGVPVTTALPDNTPEYRKVLCSALNSPFDRAAYDGCLLEVGALSSLTTATHP
jgi:hypothetical protein